MPIVRAIRRTSARPFRALGVSDERDVRVLERRLTRGHAADGDAPEQRERVVRRLDPRSRLDDDDLRYQVDFRDVYATLLTDCLSVDPTNVLGPRDKKLTLFA